VKLYGKVEDLRMVQCTCFLLGSDGEAMTVWYDTMVDEELGKEWPAVDVSKINNGDTVVVVGEYLEEYDWMWAKSIEKGI